MDKARTAVQIVIDIHAFQPVDGNWRRLDDLIVELWNTGEAGNHISDLLGILERFPEDDGAGALWSVVHAVEALPGYEAELVRSVRRGPSHLGVMLVGRILNSGASEVFGVSLLGLLHETASNAPESVRADAAGWIETHAERLTAPGCDPGGA